MNCISQEVVYFCKGFKCDYRTIKYYRHLKIYIFLQYIFLKKNINVTI